MYRRSSRLFQQRAKSVKPFSQSSCVWPTDKKNHTLHTTEYYCRSRRPPAGFFPGVGKLEVCDESRQRNAVTETRWEYGAKSTTCRLWK